MISPWILLIACTSNPANDRAGETGLVEDTGETSELTGIIGDTAPDTQRPPDSPLSDTGETAESLPPAHTGETSGLTGSIRDTSPDTAPDTATPADTALPPDTGMVPSWPDYGPVELLERTTQVGLDFTPWVYNAGDRSRCYEAVETSGGVAVGDLDGDGDLDLVVPAFSSPDALFLNDGHGRFAASASSGFIQGSSSGAFLGDIDGDGDLDALVLATWYDPLRLYVNDGQAHFTDEASARGLVGVMPTLNACMFQFGAAFGDIDSDGDLDLTIGLWSPYASTAFGSAYVFLNDGVGNFSLTAAPAISARRRATYTLDLVDVERDGDLDLLLAGDWGTSGAFLNDGAGNFTELSLPDLATNENGMGSAWGDVDGDAQPDWFVSSIYRANCLPFYALDCEGNRLITGITGPNPTNAATTFAVQDGGWAWGAELWDANNDGRLDLTVASGPISSVPWNYPAGLRRHFTNAGTAPLIDSTLDLPATSSQTRAIVAFDADRDGDLDLVETQYRRSLTFYENATPSPGVVLRLWESPGHLAHHAQVTVTRRAGEAPIYRELAPYGRFNSSAPHEVHLGLGGRLNALDHVEVTWSNGQTDTWDAVPTSPVIDLMMGAP